MFCMLIVLYWSRNFWSAGTVAGSGLMSACDAKEKTLAEHSWVGVVCKMHELGEVDASAGLIVASFDGALLQLAGCSSWGGHFKS
jgi:hypothetical protein